MPLPTLRDVELINFGTISHQIDVEVYVGCQRTLDSQYHHVRVDFLSLGDVYSEECPYIYCSLTGFLLWIFFIFRALKVLKKSVVFLKVLLFYLGCY